MRVFEILMSAALCTAVIVPHPRGPLGVSITDTELSDNRKDPYTHAPKRVLPFSIISPSGPSNHCRPVILPYMPNTTAHYWENAFASTYNLSFHLNNTVSNVSLSLCQSACTSSTFPILLFSPGLGISRQLYHILMTNIASFGYTVITIDTPGQTNIITYANGSVQYGNANTTTDAQLTSAVDVRVQDIEFVLSTLPILYPHMIIDRTPVAIFGHSLGGAASLASLLAAPQLKGGLNFDGAFFGKPLTQNTTKPFLLYTSSLHNQSSLPGAASVWKNLLGWKLQLRLNQSAHGSFEDLPVLVEAFGIDALPGAKERLGPVLGDISAGDAVKAIVGVVKVWAEFVFSDGRLKDTYVADAARKLGDVAVVNGTGV